MTNEFTLKESALEWFQNHALDALGPCELNVKTDEELEQTTFSIKLKGLPPLISEDAESENFSNEIHENINIYLETIQESFIEVIIYLQIKISSEKYNYACELSNYVNSQSNASYVQVFEQDNELVIRFKVATSACMGAGIEDFYFLLLSALSPTYKFFELFLILSSSSNTPNEIINSFNANIRENEDEDEDEVIRSKIYEFNEEFKRIIDGLDDADYWEEKLDYSINSFKLFDELINDLWPESGPMEKNIESVTAVFGSYIAVTFMLVFNGEWSIESEGSWRYIIDETDDFPMLAIQPFVWMRNRFDNNELIFQKYESMASYANSVKDNKKKVVDLYSLEKNIIDIKELNNLFDPNANGPGTDAKAVPTVFCNVNNKKVVLIKKGAIRNAKINNMYFLLPEETKHPRHDSDTRITVECYWYNWKPKTTWMGILVDEGNYEIISNYTGEVIVNFGRLQ